MTLLLIKNGMQSMSFQDDSWTYISWTVLFSGTILAKTITDTNESEVKWKGKETNQDLGHN